MAWKYTYFTDVLLLNQNLDMTITGLVWIIRCLFSHKNNWMWRPCYIFWFIEVFLKWVLAIFLHFWAKMKEKWKKSWSKNVSSSDILAWTAELTNPGEEQQQVPYSFKLISNRIQVLIKQQYICEICVFSSHIQHCYWR